MASNSRKILSLYKHMMRASQKFPQYNFRVYFTQRVRSGFKDAKDVSDPAVLSQLISKADRDFKSLKRQSKISSLYEDMPMVIEKRDG